MARISRNASLDELIHNAVTPVVARLSRSIATHIAKLMVIQLEGEVERKPNRRARAAVSWRPRPRKVEMTNWIADNRARRVPRFVIAATGLDTKKKIVAKYGENAAFAKGKPLPPIAQKVSGEALSEVKAKPPIVRKQRKAAA